MLSGDHPDYEYKRIILFYPPPSPPPQGERVREGVMSLNLLRLY